ncbi:MAG: hypothetical protein ACJAR2_001264 [Ilumatobacter sp.]|jgi:hypothetical protein
MQPVPPVANARCAEAARHGARGQIRLAFDGFLVGEEPEPKLRWYPLR